LGTGPAGTRRGRVGTPSTHRPLDRWPAVVPSQVLYPCTPCGVEGNAEGLSRPQSAQRRGAVHVQVEQAGKDVNGFRPRTFCWGETPGRITQNTPTSPPETTQSMGQIAVGIPWKPERTFQPLVLTQFSSEAVLPALTTRSRNTRKSSWPFVCPFLGKNPVLVLALPMAADSMA
jgi:hypothetical protein